jgi:hypothetical protein
VQVTVSAKHNGLMCEDIRDWREYEARPNRAKRKCRVIMIRYDDEDALIAWALVTPKYRTRGTRLSFYTRVRERNKGYGSILMDRVRAIDPKPYVFPHDTTSGGFFKKHRGFIRFDKHEDKWLR